MNDVLPLADGTILVASDSGGVWQVRRATRGISGFARPFSDGCDNPSVMCLASYGEGIFLAGCHSFAGATDSLYETRDSLAADAVVPATWRPVNAPAGVGTIYRIAIASVLERIRVVLASDGGLFWSNITAEGLPYVWTQVSPNACSGLALGPGRSVVASTLAGDQILRFDWSGPGNAATLTPQPVRLPREWNNRAPRLGRTALAAGGAGAQQMYCVAAYNDPKKGDTFLRALASSSDGGAIWRWLDAKSGGHSLYSSDVTGAQGGYDNCIAVSPEDPSTVVVGWVSLFVSTDGGKHFREFQGGTKLHADIHAVTFDAAHPKQLYVASDGGVVRTADLGRTFVASFNRELLNLQFASVPERDFYGSTTASPRGSRADRRRPAGQRGRVCAASSDALAQGPRRRRRPRALHRARSARERRSVLPGRAGGDLKAHRGLQLRDPTTIPIRRRDGSRDDNGLPNPAGARVEDRTPQLLRDKQRMYAVGGYGKPPQMLYGLFADANGEKAAWRSLAALPGSPAAQIWSMASRDGSTVFVGTATNTDKQGNVTPPPYSGSMGGQGPATALPALPAFSGGASDADGIVSQIALRAGLQPIIAYNTASKGTVLHLRGTGASASWAAASGLRGRRCSGSRSTSSATYMQPPTTRCSSAAPAIAASRACPMDSPVARIAATCTGKDFNIGRRIARMLRDAGVDDIRVRATARVTYVGDYYQTFLLTIACLVREVIVAAGKLTADELDSYTATLRAHLEMPGTLTLQPLMWQAWGRVPEPG